MEDTKGQTEIDNGKSEDRQDHGQQNETKDKPKTDNTPLAYRRSVRPEQYFLFGPWI